MTPARTARERRARAAAALTGLRPALATCAQTGLGPAESAAFLARVQAWFADAHAPLDELYSERLGGPGAVDAFVGELLTTVLRAAAERPPALRELDRRREIAPDWFQDQRMLGYVACVDRFAGSLAAARRDQPALHAAGTHEVLELDAPTVLGWRRRHPRSGWFVGLANFAEHETTVDTAGLPAWGSLETVGSADGPPEVRDGRLVLPGWGHLARRAVEPRPRQSNVSKLLVRVFR